jgi:YD repeat-containing protein
MLIRYCSLTVFISCQKGYAPDGVVIGSGASTTTSGSTSSGPLLIKDESKTTGSSEATTTTYEYDGSSRLIRLTEVDVDSANNTYTYVYGYVRDASGTIKSIVTNALKVDNPGSGFPDSLYINVNYPAGSGNYDFISYSVSAGSTTVRDSTGYVYTNGVITDVYEYQTGATNVLAAVSRVQYIYSNGNVVTEKIYTPASSSSSALTLAATYTYDHDTKVAPLITGNDAFLPGQNVGFSSKNNLSKFVATDNSTNNVFVTFNYTLQYNTNNLPITGSVVATPGNKTTTLKFTYQ